VLALSPYPRDHVGTEARFGGWVAPLLGHGIELQIDAPEGTDSRSARRRLRRAFDRAHAAHVVIVHRGLNPFGAWQRTTFERLLGRVNRRFIYDFYDALWLQQGADRSNPVVRWLNPTGRIAALCSQAAAVTVSGPYLAEFACRYNPTVHIVPMLVDPEAYAAKHHREGKAVVLGWMGNVGNIPRLLSLAPVLRRLAARHPIRVRVVAPCEVEMPGVPVESLRHPWSRSSEAADLEAMDIGLLPLSGGAIERGKFPFKALQYAAAGLPFVASAVETDSDLVSESSGGALLAAGDDEWLGALDRLVSSAALRARIGAAGRAYVEMHYSFASRAPAFADMLRQVATQ
jgi:glycosyltransferase involved in cell wall biosynthesis